MFYPECYIEVAFLLHGWNERQVSGLDTFEEFSAAEARV
jgi:hypothetical protein